MTTAAILQPGYLPWLGFFEQMFRADVFVYFDDVQYTKNDWRNRNRVKTANGAAWLTVPVASGTSTKQDLRSVTIADRQWPRRHRRTVDLAYSRAPYLDLAAGLFKIWDDPPQSLLTLDLKVIEWCRSVLGLDTPTMLASELGVHADDPTRRLVLICQRVGATRFYEGAAGRNYLRGEIFAEAGIDLEFQDYEHPTYPQQHPKQGFVSHLSVLDLILNTGPDALRILSGPIACGEQSQTRANTRATLGKESEA